MIIRTSDRGLSRLNVPDIHYPDQGSSVRSYEASIQQVFFPTS